MSSPIYGIEVNDIAGEAHSLEAHRGKVMLVVNTASKCGFTPQFEGLEQLHKDYAQRGLVVLGFPCNQFGAQDPGDNEEIASFCQVNYGVSFPMHEKVDVNGDDAHPLFRHLKSEKKGLLRTEAIKWNFTKFLIDKEGKVVERLAPQVTPDQIRAKIEALLAA